MNIFVWNVGANITCNQQQNNLNWLIMLINMMIRNGNFLQLVLAEWYNTNRRIYGCQISIFELNL